MRRFDFVVTCVCCAMLGYFGWHAYEGPRGYPYRDGLEAKGGGAGPRNSRPSRQQRVRLEHKVGLLRPESIDPDLLDELARGQLELARPGDVVAFTKR